MCYEFGRPLDVKEVQIDPPQMGEVKVKIAACAICHSDIHWIRGEWGGEGLCGAEQAAGNLLHDITSRDRGGV
jgi:D-arabinose 1-dehydrogenase-like Zn-dependent alcohol dehydrogenase